MTGTSARRWRSSSAEPGDPELAADLTAETFAAACVPLATTCGLTHRGSGVPSASAGT
jgi:hypothetical protein